MNARRIGPAVITVAAVGLLSGLGFWQLHRLSWKEALLARVEARLSAPMAPFADLAGEADAEYRRASLTGIFLPAPIFLVYAIGPNGAPGYRQVVPFRPERGPPVLVDRGWLPEARRAESTGVLAPPGGRVTVAGILRRPRRHWMQPDNDPVRDQWHGTDPVAMAAAAGTAAFAPYVLEIDSPAGARAELPNNHFGYALTWFALAGAVAVIFLAWRRRDGGAARAASGSAAPWLRPDGPRR